MKIVTFSTQKPVTITMFTIAALIFGIISFDRLVMKLLPDITYPTLTIKTEYPGAAPGEVENLISRPVEEAVGIVTNVVRVSSISRPEVSEVVIEFTWRTNTDFAALEVREKLDRVRLPEDASRPLLLRFDPSLDPIIRIGIYGQENLIALRRLAEDKVGQRLESLDGVAAVKVSGGLEEEIHIEVDETKLANLGIPIAQVNSRISQENINLTGGLLKDAGAEYLVRTLNEFRDLEEINGVIIGERNGVQISLGDIGNVTRRFKERKVITHINGEESVEVAVFKEADANTVTVALLVKKRIQEIKREIDEISDVIRLEVVYDQSKFISQSIQEVLDAAFWGGLFAIAVLYFFLKEFKSTIIISLSIPISVIVTFFLMYLSKISLNIMSLGGLALGIGMFVDNSIVVLESIDRYRGKYSLLDATILGTSEVGLAITGSTLTTVCVFVPLIFVEGIAGQLFLDQALTVTYSLLASLVVALTLIPMFSAFQIGQGTTFEEEVGTQGRISRFLTPLIVALVRVFKRIFILIGGGINLLLSPFAWAFNKGFDLLAGVYPRILVWSLDHKFSVLLIASLLFIVSLLLIPMLGRELIPEISQGEFIVDLKLPVGSPLELTDKTLMSLMEVSQREESISMLSTLAGVGTQSGRSGNEERENIGQMNVALKEGILGAKEEKAIDRLRDHFSLIPGIEYKFSRPTLFSFKTPIEIEIAGYNLNALQEAAQEVAALLHGIRGLADIRSSMEGGNPEIQLLFDRSRIATLGSSVGAIATVIKNKVQGDVVTEFSKGDKKIGMRIRVDEGDRDTIEDLRKLTVLSANGNIPISLASVADLRLERGPSEIRRIDLERVALVTANLSGRDLGGTVDEIKTKLADFRLPPDLSVTIGGQNREMAVSFKSMEFAVFLAIFLMYLVLACEFESLIHPLVIMFTIPLGLIGVVFSLLFTGGHISVVTFIGLIILAGIVDNNAVVLIETINHLRKEGLPKREATIEAGKIRLRPIFMTTATTVLGLLPMLFSSGEGAELRIPLALVIMGGLTTCTLLTLVIIPVVYLLMDRRR
ncbi:MAG: efflux RND transporter permease subunit [Candidatus Tectomicrobia bacterium]|nr:efflux RND transporter permease subunit [Candidatus Tectomicrobia bacterium]